MKTPTSIRKNEQTNTASEQSGVSGEEHFVAKEKRKLPLKDFLCILNRTRSLVEWSLELLVVDFAVHFESFFAEIVQEILLHLPHQSVENIPVKTV